MSLPDPDGDGTRVLLRSRRETSADVAALAPVNYKLRCMWSGVNRGGGGGARSADRGVLSCTAYFSTKVHTSGDGVRWPSWTVDAAGVNVRRGRHLRVCCVQWMDGCVGAPRACGAVGERERGTLAAFVAVGATAEEGALPVGVRWRRR